MSRLDLAVSAAKSAWLDLIGLMASHGLNFPTLNVMLAPGWPMPVRRAYENWVLLMDEVAKALAAQDGIPAGARLTEKDRVTLTTRTFTTVLDS